MSTENNTPIKEKGRSPSFEKTFEGIYNQAIDHAKGILEVFINNNIFDKEHYGEIISQINKLKNK